MNRPDAIIWFERLYIAAFLVGVAVTIQTWGAQARMLEGDPAMASVPWLPTVVAAARVAIAVALWYFVARAGSVVAKWIVIALAGWSALLLVMLVYGLAVRNAGLDLILPALLQNLLYIAAAAMLFRRDADPWFGTPAGGEEAA